ncbi:MAG: TetR/AcrR family transcriptional regulator [Scytolyngbya sp. HA4215-MV1]|jgi:TetR/AcrR family transcriptional repressor of nem operon|nr:TetR/AcrR family transcriptional regulator [Scytolyngbya sp. HA4215-MV1]
MNTVDTRTKILDVAQDLIQRVGVNAMSYRDISEAIGIRNAGVHYHFPTKDGLITALLERYSDDVLSLLDQIIASPESAETKLRRYFALFETTLLSGNQDKACLGGMLGAENESLDAALTEKVANFYRANERRLAVILVEGQQSGAFKFAGDAETMAVLVFSTLQGGMLLSRVKGDGTEYRAILERLVRMLKG